MITLLRDLYRDERGESNAIAIILICTILALGAIVGLTELRDQLVQEFGDIAVAIESLDQSFTGATGTFTDPGPELMDLKDEPPACLAICDVPATNEGS